MRHSPEAWYFFTHSLRERGSWLLRSIVLLLASPEEHKKIRFLCHTWFDGGYALLRQFTEALNNLLMFPREGGPRILRAISTHCSDLEIGHYSTCPGIWQFLVQCICRLRSTRILDSSRDDFRTLLQTQRFAWLDSGYMYIRQLQRLIEKVDLSTCRWTPDQSPQLPN